MTVSDDISPRGSVPILDVEQFGQIVELPPAILAQVLDSWRADTSTVGGAIVAAAAAGNVTEIAALSHRLRGSSASVGAAALASVLRRMEDDARGGRLPGPSVLDDLHAQLAAARDAVTAALAEAGSG